MKTVLKVSLQESNKAKVAISDSLLRSELKQTSSDAWELPSYDMNDGYECGGDEDIREAIQSLFTECSISEDEYWFNDEKLEGKQ